MVVICFQFTQRQVHHILEHEIVCIFFFQIDSFFFNVVSCINVQVRTRKYNKVVSFHTQDRTFCCWSFNQAVQLVQIFDTLIMYSHQLIQISLLLCGIFGFSNQCTKNFSTVCISTNLCYRSFCKDSFPRGVCILEVVCLYIFSINTDVLEATETVFSMSKTRTIFHSFLSENCCCT